MLSILMNNRLKEKFESRSAISAASLKKKKPKKDVVKVNSEVLEEVESESENGEDEEMDEEPSRGSDETAVCDVEADEDDEAYHPSTCTCSSNEDTSTIHDLDCNGRTCM
uniref:Uncharacterized protein LOC111105356 isoform X1 n=1 Tax=Crassostrea virginica TaxID=6565 RepID=A0A8B8AYC4_CRAVI|nr:uncharacterized protein LOC111105356 isoform X1 [Crassostrea virginica]